jgi:hypothetical protein
VAAPKVTVAGESPLFVDPARISRHSDVAKLGQALAERGSDVYELMAQLAAYSGHEINAVTWNAWLAPVNAATFR